MLRKLKQRKLVLPAALALALLGLILRLIQRNAGSSLWALALLSALACGFAALTARNLRPRSGFAANNRPSLFLLLELLAALLLAAASILRLFTLTGLTRWLTGLTGLAGAACLGAIAVQTISRRRPSPYLYMGWTLSLICRLIPEFRIWSVDPRISDYCFQLFASIAVMCASFHLGGFVLDCGKRRITVFFCIAGIFFCAVSIAGSMLASVLTYLSGLLFLCAVLWSVMAPPRRRRRPRPPAEPGEQPT